VLFSQKIQSDPVDGPLADTTFGFRSLTQHRTGLADAQESGERDRSLRRFEGGPAQSGGFAAAIADRGWHSQAAVPFGVNAFRWREEPFDRLRVSRR
jgi:hypothetical protein